MLFLPASLLVLSSSAALTLANPLNLLERNNNGPKKDLPSHPITCEFAFGTSPGVFSNNSFDRIVSFGDSSSDTGRAWALSGGMTPPSFYFNHTYSNGPVYPILLSQRMDLPLLGLAVGGATSNNTRAPGSKILNVTVPSSIEQVDAFLASSDGAKSKLGRSLHIILVGQNNIAANPAATGADAVDDIIYSVNKLIKSGAKHILLFNSANLGLLTPYVAAAPSLAPLLTTWSISFRDSLFAKYGPFGAKNENPKVGIVDVFSLNKIVLDSYEQFGLDPSTMGSPCVITNATSVVSVCDDAEDRQFWDRVHPSARTHSLFAAAAVAVMKAKGWVY
ncbi:hypothetical protein BDY24DRAFT_395033 [Mrakia frigida]|uniref:uncharacterized protein n=1 Tax=Mrakia frigida TaxID=29902 RepID=UPI003FCBF8B3